MTFANISLAAFGPVVWVCLGGLACVGLLAVASPAMFARITSGSSRWVETKNLLEKLDRRVDIDRFVLPYSRVLGAAVLVAVAVSAFLYLKYVGH